MLKQEINVICVDIDAAKVARMKKGEMPIYEPHLDVLFERNIAAGALQISVEKIRNALASFKRV